MTQQLASLILELRTYLESFHPALPAGILVAGIWLQNYLVRRFVPNLWESIANLPFRNGAHRPAVELARKAWQALPSVATGAFLAAMSSGETTDAVVGAVLGLLAPVWHEALKALPIPYQGGKPPAAATGLDSWRDEVTPAESRVARQKSDL